MVTNAVCAPIQSLLKCNGKHVSHSKLSEITLKHWSRIHKILTTSLAMDQPGESKEGGKREAFKMLFTHMGLQLFHEPKAVEEAIEVGARACVK